jgi:hypothetical protein
MTTGKLPGILFDNVTLKDAIFSTSLDPPKMWRDTAMIAPFGVSYSTRTVHVHVHVFFDDSNE